MRKGALAGALVSLGLWASDLWALQTLRLAGVSDQDAQRRVVAAALAALASLELRLALAHLLVGAVLGGLAGLGLARGRVPRAAGLVLLAHGLATAGMVSRYPQVYADRLWQAGGWRASLQGALTAVVPAVWDAALLTLVFGLVVAALRAGTLPARMRLRATGRWPAALAAGLLLAAALATAAARTRASAAGPNLLVIGVDSLRTDRLEAAMPFTASLAARGRLFRQVFTPLPRTFPSWVSALTGREPRAHGVRTMFPRPDEAAQAGPTVFATLADAGYRTFVVSDFAGDVFPRFAAGFEDVAAPTLTVDSLAAATALSGHRWSLPLLRWSLGRRLLPEHAEIASLSDPEWLVDATLARLSPSDGRPFAGLVFFSTAHFPYPAPHPYYRRGAEGYTGRFRYQAAPSTDEPVAEIDARQASRRYDGGLAAVDAALRRLWTGLEARGLAQSTLVAVTSDHGEDLYERPDVAGHGDSLSPTALRVPLLLLGPGVVPGPADDGQARLIDLPATLLDALGRGGRFGDGASLLAEAGPRPLCVETGLWFWPSFPRGMIGERLEYGSLSQLLEVDAATRQIVLRRDRQALVESAKHRGLILGHRLWTESPTPHGLVTAEVSLPGVAPAQAEADLAQIFEQRCVQGDPALARVLGLVVWNAGQAGDRPREAPECVACQLPR